MAGGAPTRDARRATEKVGSIAAAVAGLLLGSWFLLAPSDTFGASDVAEPPIALAVDRTPEARDIDAASATTQRRSILAGVARADGDAISTTVQLCGRVVDVHGEPVPHASVRVVVPRDSRHRSRLALERSTSAAWHAQSDENGRFELAAAPAIPGGSITAHGDGCATASAPRIAGDRPEADRSSVELVLRRVEAAVRSSRDA